MATASLGQFQIAQPTDLHSTLPPVEDRPWMHGIAGVLSGSLAAMLFYPLDLLRTRMHVFYQPGGTRPPPHSIRAIIAHEGVRGLYRGMPISVLTHGLGWGTYLLTFRVSRSYFEDLLEKFTWVGAPASDLLGAGVAAVLTSILITPFCVLKTRYQLQNGLEAAPAGWVASARGPRPGLPRPHALLPPAGWRARFSGFGPQVALSAATTIQITLYEWLRRNYFTNSQDPLIVEVALGSALAKAITCGIFNPLEVVRTRLQCVQNQHRPEYSNMRRGLHIIWRKEGIAGMYRGTLTNVVRIVPTTVVSFVLYERLLRAVKSSNSPSIPRVQLWRRSYEFLKKNESFYIVYDDLVPDYVNFFNESM